MRRANSVKRTLGILGILAVVLVLCATSALADRSSLSKPTFPRGELGEMYSRSSIWAQLDGVPPVPLPGVTDPNGSKGGGFKAGSNSLEGPRTIGGIHRSQFITPVGPSITLPRQQADRQIARLIRRLN